MTVRFTLAANLSFLWNDTAKDYIDKHRLASAAGFTRIESMFPPPGVSLEEVRSAQSQYKLSQVLINTEVDENFGYAAVKGKEAQFQASLDKTIQWAVALNIPNIHIMAGKLDYEHSRSQTSESDDTRSHTKSLEEEAYDVFKQNLVYACAKLKPLGITALIEPINRYSIPGYYLSDYNTALKLIDELRQINIDNVKLQLDIFHAQLIGGDLTHLIQRCAPHIGHVQIAQAPTRFEPTTHGEIDYAYIFTTLREVGYTGCIGLEYKPQGSTSDGLLELRKEFRDEFDWDRPV